MDLEAVKSLGRILDQMLQHQHFIVEDRKLAESLIEDVNSFRIILQSTSQKSFPDLELLRSKITTSAKMAKGFIKSHIKHIRPRNEIDIRISSRLLGQVKGTIYSMKEWVLKIQEQSRLQDLQLRSSPSVASISEQGQAGGDISVVGLEDDFQEIKERLITGPQQLQIVSVVGMGGIGKTTLVAKAFEDSIILNHFDVQVWVTVSQSYDMEQTLMELLGSMGILTENMLETIDLQKLKESFYKCLIGRRYLIVLDDVWDFKFWDDLKRVFPNDDKNASRILLTTRLENVAIKANSCHRMHLLNEEKSWNLFCHKVFGQDCSPPELKEIGKKIVQTCGGLPLAIIVLAGVLSKASRTKQYWELISAHLSSEIIKNDEKCSKMISLSYTYLPLHLKWCFLYVGIFPEDYRILVPEFVKLLVAEGFIEAIGPKSLEDVAYEYLLDLTERNLIMAGELSSMGKIKVCKIHDLVRDFCIRESQNNEHFCITDRSLYGIPIGATVRLLSVHPDATNFLPSDEKKLSSLSVNSVVNFDPEFHIPTQLQSQSLRVLYTRGRFPIYVEGEQNRLKFDNLQYLACEYEFEVFPSSSSSSYVFQNLQTLVLHECRSVKEVAIWKMPKLRHVLVDGLEISYPLEGEKSVVLENLQTLSRVEKFRCSEEFLKRIPSLKKLGMHYSSINGDLQDYSLSNFVNLHKLEELKFVSSSSHFQIRELKFIFLPSLKKLTIESCQLAWEDIHAIGCLSNLEVLKLKYVLFRDGKWEPAEEEFSNLKYLLLHKPVLEHWKVDGVCFPSLKILILSDCTDLMKIPPGIGDIPTLQLIELHNHTKSLLASVEEMLKEQRELGNDALRVHIGKVTTEEELLEGAMKLLERTNKIKEGRPLLFSKRGSLEDATKLLELTEEIRMGFKEFLEVTTNLLERKESRWDSSMESDETVVLRCTKEMLEGGSSVLKEFAEATAELLERTEVMGEGGFSLFDMEFTEAVTKLKREFAEKFEKGRSVVSNTWMEDVFTE